MKTNNNKPKGDGSLVQPFLGSWDPTKVMGSNLMVRKWNLCQLSTNELDLGVPTGFKIKDTY
jgi:hypothetical protein